MLLIGPVRKAEISPIYHYLKFPPTTVHSTFIIFKTTAIYLEKKRQKADIIEVTETDKTSTTNHVIFILTQHVASGLGRHSTGVTGTSSVPQRERAAQVL